MKSTPSSSPTRRMAARSGATVLAATAVALLAAGCSGTSTAGTGAAAPSSAANPAPGHRAAGGVAGKITAENGSTWTVVNPRGTQFTVDITPQTTFGSKQAPATEQQFPVGSSVRVIGTRNGDTVTATRVGAARPAGSAPTAPAGAAPSTSTSST